MRHPTIFRRTQESPPGKPRAAIIGHTKQLTRFLAALLAGVITGHPPKDLVAPHENNHHRTQAIEPDHIHPELLQPGYLATSGSAIAGPASAWVPFVASDDDQQLAMAVAAMRSRAEQLQRLAYLDDSPVILPESLQ